MIVAQKRETGPAGRTKAPFSERAIGRACRLFFLCTLVLSVPVSAEETPSVSTGPQLGDCVQFREGGDGFILKSPTYWLKGKIAGISQEHPEDRQTGNRL